MPAKVAPSVPASHREELASVRPAMLKVDLKGQAPASSLRQLTGDAIRATSGNARAAAIDLHIHEAHLSRQLKDGTLRLEQLETLGPTLLAELGRQLQETFGPLAQTPREHADRKLDEIAAAVNEVRQLVKEIA